MGTSDLPEMYAHTAQGLQTYISGKSQVSMLQLLCNIFIIANSLNANMSVIMVMQQVT